MFCLLRNLLKTVEIFYILKQIKPKTKLGCEPPFEHRVIRAPKARTRLTTLRNTRDSHGTGLIGAWEVHGRQACASLQYFLLRLPLLHIFGFSSEISLFICSSIFAIKLTVRWRFHSLSLSLSLSLSVFSSTSFLNRQATTRQA